MTLRFVATAAFVSLAVAACGGAPEKPVRVAAPEPPPVEPLPADGPSRAAEQPSRVDLPNGLTALVTTAPADGDCQVQLGVFAGALFVAPGLAELAAHVVLHSADSTRGVRSLAQEIARLGGTVEVRAGLTTTWFDLRVPGERLGPALAALRRALEATTKSRSQIARLRDDLVTARCAEITQDPVGGVARALLLAEPGSDAYVDGLLDLDPGAVVAFHSRLYRPERCLLTVRAPLAPQRAAAVVGAAGRDGLGGWVPPPAMPGEVVLLPRRFEPGLYWSETGGALDRSRVAAVLRLPDATQLSAAEHLVLQACLTLEGAGGRLEQLQRELGLGHVAWRARVVRTTDAAALVLEAEASPGDALSLWSALQRARRSLVDVPPTESELRLALRRAQLSAGLLQLDDDARLRTRTTLGMRGLPVDSLRQRLDQLADTTSWDVAAAAAAYVAEPAWMVVLGGDVPARSRDVRTFRLLPAGLDPAAPAPPVEAGAAASDPWLRRAGAAVCEASELARLVGFEAELRLEAEGAPESVDVLRWRQGGALERERTVLGRTVRTTLEGDRWSESIDGTQQPLSRAEAATIRREMARHPLMLLAAHARGELRFRPVAQRRIGDREHMVLEAVDARFDRLRVHVDVESALIRVVESWEQMPDGTVVHLRENWSDYRTVGEVRAPFLRQTAIDDGRHRSAARFTRWTPTFVPPKRGG